MSQSSHKPFNKADNQPSNTSDSPETADQLTTRIKRTLSRTDNQFALFFVLVNFPTATAKIATQLKNTLQTEIQRPIIELSIHADELKNTTLDAWLNQKLQTAPENAIVFLYQFAQLLPAEQNALRKNLQQINWRRASLASIKRPLLIWLPRYAIDTLAEYAPDFYDWYSNVYDFASEAETLKTIEKQRQIEFSGEVDPAERMSQAEKQKWIHTLQGLIDENPQANKYRATLLGNLGRLFKSIGELKNANEYYQESLKISQEIEDKSGEGTTLNNISQIYDARGDYQTALKYLEQSLKIAQDIGDKSGEGTTLNNISQIYKARGDYHTALKYLEQSLKIRQEIGDKSGEGTTLNNISQIYDARGDYQTALKYLEQSLKIQQEIGDKSGEGTMLNNISQIYHTQGDYQTALKYLEQSLKIQQDIGDKSGEGTTLNNISGIYHAQGDYQTALKYLEQSLKIAQEIGDKSNEGGLFNNISQIYNAQGDYQTALKYLEQSLKIRQEIGDKSGEGTTLNNISGIYHAQGDYQTALKYLEQSLKIQQEISNIAGSCATLFNMGHIYYQNNKIKKAMQTWLEVYQMAKPINLAQALEALANLAPHLDMPEGLEGWEALAQQVEK